MLSKIQKWGNSQGIRIPLSLLEDSHLKIGDEVDINIDVEKIIVEPVKKESTKKIHGRFKIQDLIEEMPENYNSNEENWGNSVGREVW